MAEYTITVKVPFAYDGDSGNILGIGLAYLIDAVAEQGTSGTLPDDVTVKIKKKPTQGG